MSFVQNVKRDMTERSARRRARRRARRIEDAEYRRDVKIHTDNVKRGNSVYRDSTGMQTTGHLWSVLKWVVIFGFLFYVGGLFAGVGDWRWLGLFLVVAVISVILMIVEKLLPRTLALIGNIVILIGTVALLLVLFATWWDHL